MMDSARDRWRGPSDAISSFSKSTGVVPFMLAFPVASIDQFPVKGMAGESGLALHNGVIAGLCIPVSPCVS